MTRTTTTTTTINTTNEHSPSPVSTRRTRPPVRRTNRLLLGGILVLAALAGAVALDELRGSDGPPSARVERSVLSASAAPSMSANAAERWAITEAEANQRRVSTETADRLARLELSRRTALARTPASTPAVTATLTADAFERRSQLELSRRTALCRSDASSVDALERCLRQRAAPHADRGTR